MQRVCLSNFNKKRISVTIGDNGLVFTWCRITSRICIITQLVHSLCMHFNDVFFFFMQFSAPYLESSFCSPVLSQLVVESKRSTVGQNVWRNEMRPLLCLCRAERRDPQRDKQFATSSLIICNPDVQIINTCFNYHLRIFLLSASLQCHDVGARRSSPNVVTSLDG